MFFFDPPNRKDKKELASSFLHSCGTTIPQSHYQALYPFIEKHLDQSQILEKKRKEVYANAFGAPCNFALLRQEIESKVAAIKPSLKK